MQPFLPYKDFEKSIKCLDYKRLGKQRVEAYQLLCAKFIPGYGWKNHPCYKMWHNYPDALRLYMNLCITEWIDRGYNNTMKFASVPKKVIYPNWLGDERVHSSHRSNLLFKDYNYYKRFNWKEPNNLAYYWPEGAEI